MEKSNNLERLKIPVFWRFIIMYLLISGLVVAALMPIYYKAIELSKASYLRDAEYALKLSSVNMQKTMEEIYQLPFKMDDSPYYVNLKLIHGDKLPHDSYSKLYMAQKYFTKQMTTLENVEEVFLYLSNNTVVFGKERIFDSIHDYLNFDLVYQKYSPSDIIQWMTTIEGRTKILPATLVALHNDLPKKFLTIVMSRQTDSSIVGVLLSEDALLRHFNVQNLPKDSFLYITNEEGKFLYNYQYNKIPLEKGVTRTEYDGELYSVLSTYISFPPCNIVLGIPDYYFEELHLPLKKLITGYMRTGILVGIIFSSLFAAYNYLPIRKLVSIPIKSGYYKKARLVNEYNYIGRFIEFCSSEISQLKTSILDMEKTLKANMFIRLLYGMVNTKSEYILASKLIPQIDTRYRIALLKTKYKICASDTDYLNYLVYDKLSTLLPTEFVQGQINDTEIAVLFTDTEDNIKELTKILNTINHDMYHYDIYVKAGVSDSNADRKEIHRAFFHAQSSLMMADSNSISFYCPDPSVQIKYPIDFYGLQKLYGLIIAGNREEVDETIKAVTRKLIFGGIRSKQEVMQVFYMIRFTLISVIDDTGLDSREFFIRDFIENESVDVLFENLNQHAFDIIDALEAKKNKEENKLREEILKYIQENYSDPDIYADSIAEKYNITRNYVYSLVREETGKSLGEYIENLRMVKATDLLKDTEMSVAEISIACGYNSTNTFYKVFKKNFNVSPSTYRNQVS